MTFRFARLSVVPLEGRDATTVIAAPPAPVMLVPTQPRASVVFVAAPSAPPAPTAPSAPHTTPGPTPHPTPHPTPAPTPGPNTGHQLLTGSGSGDFISTLLVGGTASGFHFNGTATIARLGTVDVYAHLYSVGFRAHGSAHGEVTLSNDRGSVVLFLFGADQTSLSALPRQFSYRVLKATGAFGTIKDSGTIRLVRTVGDPVRNGFHYFEAGSFRITL